jgi:hypothetical protein
MERLREKLERFVEGRCERLRGRDRSRSEGGHEMLKGDGDRSGEGADVP